MEITERSIVLSYDELRILLYSQGCRRCEGVFMPGKDFSQGDILRSLMAMVKNGLLTIGMAGPEREALPVVFHDSDDCGCTDTLKSDETFFIRKDLLKMIKIIAVHEGAEIKASDEGRRQFVYYSEQGVVVSERYKGRKESIRLTYHSVDEYSGNNYCRGEL